MASYASRPVIPHRPASNDAGYIKEGVLTRVLPPDVSEAKFGRARAAWAAIVGAEHVVSSEGGLTAYLDPFAVGPSASRPVFTPSAALLPASVEEIQAVLRIATEYR